jgi:hypothetical protein
LLRCCPAGLGCSRLRGVRTPPFRLAVFLLAWLLGPVVAFSRGRCRRRLVPRIVRLAWGVITTWLAGIWVADLPDAEIPRLASGFLTHGRGGLGVANGEEGWQMAGSPDLGWVRGCSLTGTR